ncbi:Uncharacterised protein [Enterobacter hormaechei]|uniref:Uncharacterized protein n=1 Tax=Leclercia adecarboxylata TaxID=83655 RepID=A0A482M1G5_9ENTR|nr:Hypothetical protein [Leclercia adecarboxylata]SAA69877.1 Uncharacterised protein [Enterobacter hormaechei]SAA87649.1 Uncharacterised protein [Enterobacter hormaechei]SAB11289.1 Uncharacterised protein [Enterobacter hormaechei]SAB24503.1 Uncharacterised protein [Enterobacter hormaechei]
MPGEELFTAVADKPEGGLSSLKGPQVRARNDFSAASRIPVGS